MIKYIKRKFVLTQTKKLLENNFVGISNYLEQIIDYSVVNKDIKAFLFFLYLHDTSKILHKISNEKEYKKWRYSITYLYAYEIDMFANIDLYHYKNNIKNDIDKKILTYLTVNMITNENKFLNPDTLGILTINLRIYAKIIGRLMVLYRYTLHKRYMPGGKGYLDALERFNKRALPF